MRIQAEKALNRGMHNRLMRDCEQVGYAIAGNPLTQREISTELSMDMGRVLMCLRHGITNKQFAHSGGRYSIVRSESSWVRLSPAAVKDHTSKPLMVTSNKPRIPVVIIVDEVEQYVPTEYEFKLAETESELFEKIIDCLTEHDGCTVARVTRVVSRSERDDMKVLRLLNVAKHMGFVTSTDTTVGSVRMWWLG